MVIVEAAALRRAWSTADMKVKPLVPRQTVSTTKPSLQKTIGILRSCAGALCGARAHSQSEHRVAVEQLHHQAACAVVHHAHNARLPHAPSPARTASVRFFKEARIRC